MISFCRFLAITSLTVFLSGFSTMARAQVIKLNCADRAWYPFLTIENGQARGLFIDIVTQAIENLGFSVRIQALPFKRAVKYVQFEKADGIIGIGYQRDLGDIIAFPPGAASAVESPFRILQVDNVLVSPKSHGKVQIKGFDSIPSPVRVVWGDPLTKEFKAAGVDFQEVRHDKQNFFKMLRDGDGVIITTSLMAEKLMDNERFRKTFRINPKPIASHSYYLGFAVNGRLPEETRKDIWNEISRLRDDYLFMLKVFSKY